MAGARLLVGRLRQRLLARPMNDILLGPNTLRGVWRTVPSSLDVGRVAVWPVLVRHVPHFRRVGAPDGFSLDTRDEASVPWNTIPPRPFARLHRRYTNRAAQENFFRPH